MQSLVSSSGESANPVLLVVGMLNGMIGGVILVLPLLVLQTGVVGSGLIIAVSGALSCYSCMLCVKHLGNHDDLDQAIMAHFNNLFVFKVFYDFVVFLNLLLLLVLYFELIIQQWLGMFDAPVTLSMVNFFVLLGLVMLMKYLEFGVSLLAYGIVSCVGYCVFLIWMLASAPQGQNKMILFGSGGVTLAASMGQAFSIQTIFIPILRKSKNRGGYPQYILITFVSGFVVYTYIAYMGSFGILNRQPATVNPETIEQYFPSGYWQLYSLEIIYLVHLYSVFPEFLLISNKRLFSIFGMQITPKGTISWQEIAYAVALISVCLIIRLTKVEIGDIIELNGAVVGFFFIYFFPVVTHLQCLYFPSIKQSIKSLFISNSAHHDKKQEIQISAISEQSIRISLLTENKQSTQQQAKQNRDSTQKSIQMPNLNKLTQNNCNARKPTLIWAIVDGFVLLIMLAIGVFIMYRGVANVFA